MDYFAPAFNQQLLYKIMTTAITPRPIAWVSTISPNGKTNLAPFSFFTVASVNPPILSVIQVNPRDKKEKDTLINLRATKECVVNIVTEASVEIMNQTCADYPYEVSEIDELKIETIESQTVKASSLFASPVRFECRLKEVLEFGQEPGAGKMMLLEVIHISTSQTQSDDPLLTGPQQRTVGKLAGDDYCYTNETFSLSRPIL
ncbi:flavin reductase family protein [Leeia sp. TBRC 13508]|uniref:Flavin reductase family protein n=1 Tax=Leeia speluncae TaxID=2884804 RepID=A0ABS8D2U7_9NEIS|nr:flavin reductase family protein [Leeia speluncae]MCB6182494.1 flavin reductase family protein [Leeia speluncae]